MSSSVGFIQLVLWSDRLEPASSLVTTCYFSGSLSEVDQWKSSRALVCGFGLVIQSSRGERSVHCILRCRYKVIFNFSSVRRALVFVGVAAVAIIAR